MSPLGQKRPFVSSSAKRSPSALYAPAAFLLQFATNIRRLSNDGCPIDGYQGAFFRIASSRRRPPSILPVSSHAFTFKATATMPSTYELSPQQFAAVSELDGPERYTHFVSRVADWQTVWGLRSEEGWVMVADDCGNSALPFWPHPEYAAICATGEWAGNVPTPVSIHDFVEQWLPKMSADGVAVAVFPTPALRGVIVLAQLLEANIRNELSQIE